MTSKLKKIIKPTIIFFMVIIIFIGIIVAGILIPIKASWFSTEEHVERISKKVEKGYLNNETGYTDFEVFPLYNEHEEVEVYLVEFKPTGFMLIKSKDTTLVFAREMYLKSINPLLWRKYEFRDYGVDDYINDEEDVKEYEVDINGNFIYYDQSPYSLTNVINDKIYLLNMNQNSVKTNIPAIKKNEKYINLITMKEFAYKSNIERFEQAYIDVGFYPLIGWNL